MRYSAPVPTSVWVFSIVPGWGQLSWPSVPPHPAHQPSNPTLHLCCQAPINTALLNSRREANWKTAGQVSSHKNSVYSCVAQRSKHLVSASVGHGNNLVPRFGTLQFTEAFPISWLLSSPNSSLPGKSGSQSDTTTHSHTKSK